MLLPVVPFYQSWSPVCPELRVSPLWCRHLFTSLLEKLFLCASKTCGWSKWSLHPPFSSRKLSTWWGSDGVGFPFRLCIKWFPISVQPNSAYSSPFRSELTEKSPGWTRHKQAGTLSPKDHHACHRLPSFFSRQQWSLLYLRFCLKQEEHSGVATRVSRLWGHQWRPVLWHTYQEVLSDGSAHQLLLLCHSLITGTNEESSYLLTSSEHQSHCCRFSAWMCCRESRGTWRHDTD